jgi:Flp pilus assembly protein TadG
MQPSTVIASGRRGRDDRGVVVVEFALVLPIVVAILLGIFTGGIALNHKLSITEAAREGARYGATVPQNQCATSCGGLDWAHLVQSAASSRANGDATSVCVALVTGSGGSLAAVGSSYTTAGGTSPCFADSGPDTGLRVQVQVQRVGDQLQYLFGNKNLTLVASSTARYEQ